MSITFLYFLPSIVLFICFIIAIAVFHKKFKKQKSINAKFEKNQETLQKNLMNLSSLVSKAQTNVDKQYDNIKKIEMTVVQKLSPLLDKNQVIDELRRKLNDSEHTVTSLRSTILQMSQTFKRMQKQEKDEHSQETVKRRKTKKEQVKQ